jgi:hypothetical protein
MVDFVKVTVEWSRVEGRELGRAWDAAAGQRLLTYAAVVMSHEHKLANSTGPDKVSCHVDPLLPDSGLPCPALPCPAF